jgi:hypothetical protein
MSAPNDLTAPELTEAAAVLGTVEITVDEIEIPMDEVEIPMDELAPTMQEFVMPEMSNVYVSAPDYDEEEEEEVSPAFEAIESSFEEEVISQEIVLEDFNASFEEEEVSEVFELNMEEEEAPSFTTEFVLNKPLNIYAEAELDATPEPSMPTNNEVIANTVVFESIEPIATEIAAATENVETSFRNVEMDTEEEPTMQLVMREESVVGRAKVLGVSPESLMYDLLLENDGTAFYAIFGSNFAKGDLNASREMLLHPDTITGLSDAGAHVSFICDCSMPTFHLTHWVRDRSRGERLPLESTVRKLTKNNADLYGLSDRGSLEVGKRADVNVINLDKLTIQAPFVRKDLPAGGSRILQPSTGYAATLVNGVVTRLNDADTGARPGRLVRS